MLQTVDKPRIAVNTRLLLKGKLEGIGRFSYETLRRMVVNHPEVDFYFLFDRAYDPSFIFSKNVKPVVIPVPTRHPVLYRIWFDVLVPFFLKKKKIDLFLSLDGFLSLRTKVPSIPVIHDLNFEHYPEGLPLKYSKLYRNLFPKYASLGSRVVTVSEFSKNDIFNSYNISKEKIDVVSNAVSSNFEALTEERKRTVKSNLTQDCDYFIYVGSLNKRKNTQRLIEAFDLFKQKTSSTMKLAMVGGQMWDSNEILNTISSKNDVFFTGHVEDNELNDLLGAASALVYVSYFEGFGIPILEAMRCKVPVITSKSTALEEVANKSALLVDPFSVDEIAEAMNRIVSDEQLKEELIRKGLKRSYEYSWDQSAIALWNSINKVITC